MRMNRSVQQRHRSRGQRSRLTILIMAALLGMVWCISTASEAQAQSPTDIDLITNISADKTVVIRGETIVYTVTVENRGPAVAVNADWLVEIASAAGISNLACTSANGATCPATFDTAIAPTIAAVIPSMPADSVVTLTFETTARRMVGDGKSVSTVTANSQTDSVPETNVADINISVVDDLLSFGVTKTIARYENAAGNPVGTPSSGDYVIYTVVVTNDGVDDVYGLLMTESIGVESGTGSIPTNVVGNATFSNPARLSGYSQNYYAGGTTLESITCIGTANGATCPSDVTFTTVDLSENITIPFMPGRTRGAATNPGAYPASTVTFEVRELIGDITCSTIGGFRTFVNRASLSTAVGLNSETSGLGAPYGPGDSTDNIATTSFNVNAPTCAQYDIDVQITEPTAQSTNGVTENTAYEYTVTVVNSGPDSVSDMPFVFGLFQLTNFSNPDQMPNLFTMNSGVTCVPLNGATCPTGYTVNPHQGAGTANTYRFAAPDLNATIPAMPGSSSLTFTITGIAGEADVCGNPFYFNAYAHALPNDLLGETNVQVPTVVFESYYRNTSSYGYPAAGLTNGNYYGNNGYNLQTQWVTGTGACGPTVIDYDLSAQLTGPFPDATSTTPIAGPLAPGQLVYYRASLSNLDDGSDVVDFLDPALSSTYETAAQASISLDVSTSPARPSWIDLTSDSGFGTASPDYFHPLDVLPGTYPHWNLYPESYPTGYYGGSDNLPWAALEEIGIACLSTSGGAECPDPNDDNGLYPWDSDIYPDEFISSSRLEVWLMEGGYLTSAYLTDAGRPLDDYPSLHLPVGSNIQFLLPFKVPEATTNCVPGGDIWVSSPATNGGLTVQIFGSDSSADFNIIDRSTGNNNSTLTLQVQIPACVQALEIDKQIAAPAAADVLPASGIVEYTVDLTYPAAAGTALDVAQFTDIPDAECSNGDYGSSCVDWEIAEYVSCSVISGTAACPPSVPIGQKRAQDGTLTPTAAGTIDTRWGTPNATSVAGGAAFEPGSTIRLTLRAQASSEVDPIGQLLNTAAFASDPESSLFGYGMYTEDTVAISPPSADSMVLNKQVNPSAAAAGETIVYTLEAINNGPSDGQGAYIEDALPAELLAANPAGFTNIQCAPITTVPPLLKGPNVADCNNVAITNNGASGFRIDMTGPWVFNSGYRFTFEAIAPEEGTSVKNLARLVPPPSTNVQRFNAPTDSTVNFRTPDTVAIGSFIWEDLDNDGVQDPGETGLSGATVRLLDGSGNPADDINGNPVAEQTTDATGLYFFDELAVGNYIVEVEAPAGYIPTANQVTGAINAGTSTNVAENDTNIDNSPGAGVYRSGVITLALVQEPDETETVPGDNQDDAFELDGNMTVDFGFVQAEVAVGSFVWDDLDGDGIQDPGEPGLSGATVRLLDGSGNPANDLDGNPVADQTTLADGLYFFDNLAPGAYIVEVEPSADYLPGPTQSTGVINGSTSTNVAANDSNIAGSPSAGVYRSGVVTLTAGGEPTEAGGLAGDNQDDTADTDGNMTVDFAFVSVPTLAVSKVLNTPEPVRVGDILSFTIRITNTGSTAIAVLPLADDYDRDYISYMNATPASDDNTNDGTVNWTDLTVSFGSNLAPGAFFDVVVRFMAMRDTGLSGPTVNTASVSGAEDVNGNTPDPVDDSDDVAVLAPTAVYLSSRSATRSDAGITLAWTTADETQIVAFRVVRTNSDGSEVLLTPDAIPAQFAGQPTGTSYRFVDSDLRGQSTVRYDLELIAPDGSVTRLDLGRVNAGYGVYLPLVTR
jgi:uncharacterized repeat protein (TIGR01451 family)